MESENGSGQEMQDEVREPLQSERVQTAPTREEAAFRVVLLFEDGDEVEAAFVAGEEEAEAAARELVARVSRAGEWPRFGSRFYRPERVVAVEIRRRPLWTGAEDRVRWAGGDEPAVA
ncbi:MAG: hypothetical protein ICV74_02450 [Thermoleophilia bacterium]|nr:hypothetical protein [Thermoleophilia bacterium]